MERDFYPIDIYCPISNETETVFFYPVQHDGKQYVNFNGCDHNYSKCKECEVCHKEAYKLLCNLK